MKIINVEEIGNFGILEVEKSDGEIVFLPAYQGVTFLGEDEPEGFEVYGKLLISAVEAFVSSYSEDKQVEAEREIINYFNNNVFNRDEDMTFDEPLEQ